MTNPKNILESEKDFFSSLTSWNINNNNTPNLIPSSSLFEIPTPQAVNPQLNKVAKGDTIAKKASINHNVFKPNYDVDLSELAQIVPTVNVNVNTSPTLPSNPAPVPVPVTNPSQTSTVQEEKPRWIPAMSQSMELLSGRISKKEMN